MLAPPAFSQAPKLVSPADTWPREYAGAKGGRLSLYQPQFEKWDNYTTIEARVAGAVAAPGAKTPEIGAFKITGTTDVDPITRKVRITNIQLSEINFPTLDPKLLPPLSKTLEEILPKNDVVVSMDRILASLERNKDQQKPVAVKNDPPPIYFSDKPAVLMILDGEPIWSPIVGTDLKYAVNTNWDLFQDASGALFLRNDDAWLKADHLYGPWTPAGNLPVGFSKLPKDNENWKDVFASIPGKKISADKIPTIFVSKIPAEMIVINGQPVLEAIPGTKLTWVQNTESDLFVYGPDQNYYFLTSGRWFKTSGGVGSKWIYASDQLPDDFQKIPKDSPKANVLASVPGTREAEEALIQADIPIRAKVKRGEAKAAVTYAGDPKFDNIQGTDLQYAANTSSQVISFKDKYYLVKDGVWFVSSSATGPWVVADQVPQEIYNIPPSSPLYNVTYVKIYDSNPEYVTTGYTAGYLGAFVVGTALGATLAYGSGWYYPPYIHGAWYYPRPYTYGMGAYYNPWTGSYGRYGSYYGPYGGVGYGASYNPATGTYARGAAAYGPYGGYRAGGQAYNPWTNTYGATRQGSNGYASWGSSVVQRNDDWARTARYSNGSNGIAGYNTSGGNSGFVAKGNNDVYAGRDGNVYRKTDNGWQKYDSGSWNSVGGNKNLQSSQTGSQSSLQNKAQAKGVNQSSLQAKAQQNGVNKSSLQNSALQGGQIQRPSTNNRDVDSQLSRDSFNRDRGNQRAQGFQNYERSGGNFNSGYAGRQSSGFQGSRDYGGGGFQRGGGGGGFGGGGGGFRGGGGGGGRRR